ncbi:hypothetical protein ABIC80_004378 [Kosakonia sp. 1610]
MIATMTPLGVIVGAIIIVNGVNLLAPYLMINRVKVFSLMDLWKSLNICVSVVNRD